VLLRITGTPHFLPTGGDMKFYSDWAQRIAAGVWTDHQAFYGLPLYAYLVAGIYRVAGFQPYLVILLQTIAEAFTSLLIYQITVLVCGSGKNETSREPRPATVGFAAALGWIFFVPAQAYSTILMPSAFLVTAFWFVVWWVLKSRESRPRLVKFFLLGLMMGFTAMMVANILFLLPLVGTAIFFRREWAGWQPRAPAMRSAAAALLMSGVFLGASPCWVHNYFVAGEPVFLSAHGGINFWLGNNASANGYPNIPAGLHADQEGMLKDSILWAERAVGHPLRRSEVSVFWTEQAHQYIRENPLQWLRLMATKLGNYWNGFQYDDLGVILTMREDGVLFPGLSFGLVAALALPGVGLAVARRPGALWIAAAVGLHMASLMTVFVTERYRLASVPGLLILATVGLAELWRWLTARRWLPAAAYATVLAGAVMLVSRPVDPKLQNLAEYNAAVADLEQGRLDRAKPRLDKVFASTPDNAPLNLALGNYWLGKEDREKAKYFYFRALRLDSQQKQALNNLGVIAMEEKRWSTAERLLLGCLQLAPTDAKANYLLAKARIAQNNFDGASDAIDNALRLQPERADFQQLRAELAQLRLTSPQKTATSPAN
jgi:tetratricopeptide (TPR) repeat protein